MFNKGTKISRGKRWAIFGAMMFFVLQISLPIALQPKPALAIFGIGDITLTTVVANPAAKLMEAVSKAIKTASDVAFKNILKNYLNNLAYNYAVKIATGKPGQKPLFVTNPSTLLKQTADAAAGDFLDSMANSWSSGTCQGHNYQSCGSDNDCKSYAPLLLCPKNAIPSSPCAFGQGSGACFTECDSSVEAKQFCISRGCILLECGKNQSCPSWEGSGQVPEKYKNYEFAPRTGAPQCIKDFSLCEPQDITTKIKLQTWAREATFGGPQDVSAKCTLSEIIDNVNATSKQRLFEFSKSFNPEATEIGAYLEIVRKADEEAAKAEDNKKFTQSLSGEMEPATTAVTKENKTPAKFIEQAQGVLFNQSISQSLVQTGSMVADAVGTFTNTLASKLLDRLINQGWNPFASKGGTKSSTSLFADIFGGTSPGITAAKLLFSDLQKTEYSTGGAEEVLPTLASCPDTENSTPDTCVIDNRLQTAIEQELTVQQAIDQGLLDAKDDSNKIFGFYSDGTQPEYYNGYPYRSLVILRKYRIIPVGWELAAKYIRDYAKQDYTLSDLIAEYDNPISPFYRLVDPNWVLKSPEIFCKREGSGEKVVSTQAIRSEDTNGDGTVDLKDVANNMVQRQDNYCADEQMCLAENDDGTCKKFGYCVEEKPIWKFNSESCESQYNSCQSLANSTGDEVAYLTSTTNTDGCNSSNVGCSWYCQDWNAATGKWNCTGEPPTMLGTGGKISFNNSITACDASSEGCTQLIRQYGAGANLIYNGGLEQFGKGVAGDDGIKDTALPDSFDDWNYNKNCAGSACGDSLVAVSDAYEGSTAARIKMYPGSNDSAILYIGDTSSGSPTIVSTGYLTDHRTFTLSLYAKRAADDPDCTGNAGQLDIDLMRPIDAANSEVHPSSINVSDEWRRYVYTITYPSIPTGQWGSAWMMQGIVPLITRPDDIACDVIIDDIMVQEGASSNYIAYEDNPKTNLRIAPDFLSCTGNSQSDNQACGEYALFCSANEVGCELYTSLTSNQKVSGIISDPNNCDPNNPDSCDQCPAEFVGCRAYREMPIEHVPQRPARDPVSFIATTGQSCNASAVGCEEYTNLDAVGQGGEGKEYYSNIRLCVQEDDASIKTFYAWEGSDEFGYQLKKYSLKQSNWPDLTNPGEFGPCTNMMAENSALAPENRWPNCVDGKDFDDNGDGFLESHLAATCLAAEVGVNPDCTEFYDDNGLTYYYLKSRVIFASADCNAYRNSIDGASAIYHLIPKQSVSCSASQNGCRSYKGNAGDNVRQVYSESFENGTISPWIGNVTYSNESVNVGGHSMLINNNGAIANVGTALGMTADKSYEVSFWAKATADTPITFTLNTATPLVFPGQAVAGAEDWNQFHLGPVYVPAGTDLSAVQLVAFGTNAFYIDNIIINEVYENTYLIKDSYKECSGYENCDQYKDRSNTIHYLKSFTRLCRDDKVGCEAMIDTKNTVGPSASDYTVANVNRFLRGDINKDGTVDDADQTLLDICINSAVGCPDPAEIADLNNSGNLSKEDSTYLYQFLHNGGPSPLPRYITGQVKTGVANDSMIFVVNDPEKSCSATAVGCERLGKPVIEADGSVSSFSDAYLANQPDNYGQTMCYYENSSCNEYTSSSGAKYYFKDPGKAVCNFTKVPGQSVAGWYQSGTTEGTANCPVTNGVCVGGHNKGQACNTALNNQEFNDCDDWPSIGADLCVPRDKIVAQPAAGWVGACPATATGCTEYRDPENPVDYSDPDHPKPCDVYLADGGGDGVLTYDCNSYYYLSGNVDKSSCNNLVDRKSGCLMFNDTSVPTLNYDATETKNEESPALCTIPRNSRIMRGDTNNDNEINIGDPQLIGAYLNGTGTITPVERGDADNDGDVDMDDINYIVAYIFSGGDPPLPQYLETNCDSNSVIQAKKDRVCNKWLECADKLITTNESGQNQDLCLKLKLCDEMDEQTGVCTDEVQYERVNDTYSSPAFADKIKNYSGMVLAGMDWDKRCSKNMNYVCDIDADCMRCGGGVRADEICTVGGDCPGGDCVDNGTCSPEPQLTEGDFPYQAMEEVGTTSPQGDIISYGDFGDSSYFKNAELSKVLSAVDESGQADAPLEIEFSKLTPTQSIGLWSARQNPILPPNSLPAPVMLWGEEAASGQIPSPNANLDENNIGHVVAAGNYTGATYDLQTRVFKGEEYAVSFKIKTNQVFRPDDYIYVQLEYLDNDGNQINAPNGTYMTFDRIKPSLEWQKFALGPITAGVDDDGNDDAKDFVNARLNIIYVRDSLLTPFTDLEFYLDDVSMKPVLQVQERKCIGGANDGNYCETDDNCPSGYCYTQTNLARSCRMYPNAEAPYCTYTDENNTTFNGWYGYCIESDPNNSKYCLNWWPVDLISGETDIFSNLKTTQYSGRRPLYYCMEAPGNNKPSMTLSTTTNEGTFPAATTGDNYYIQPLTASQWHDDEFASTVYTNSWIVQTGGDDACQPYPPSIWPGNPPGADCNWSSTNSYYDSKITSNITEDDISRVELEWVTNASFGWGGYSGYFTPETMTTAGYACNKNSSPLKCDSGAAAGRVDRVVSGSDRIWRLYPIDTCHENSGYQCMWLQIIFDNNTGKLKEIRTIGEDSTAGKDEYGAFHLNFYLKESCSAIAQAVDLSEEPIAWSSRTGSSSTYILQDNPPPPDVPEGLKYQYEQDYKPFGAFVNPSTSQGRNELDPTSWPMIPVEQRENPLTSNNARAGSPYSCVGNCWDRGCNWDETNDCSSNDLTSKCLAHNDGNMDLNDGICVGLGSGFCLKDTKIRCTENAQCTGADNRCVLEGAGVFASGRTRTDAINTIKRLFAKPVAGWGWDSQQRQYIKIGVGSSFMDDWINGYDISGKHYFGYNDMPVCNVATRPDNLGDDPGDYCGMPPVVSDIRVGRSQTTMAEPDPLNPVSLSLWTGEVHLAFNVNVDKEQKPLKRIEVNWGDGSNFIIQGKYDSNTIYLTHTYNFAQPFTPYNPADPNGTGVRIKIVDNWDWCGVTAAGVCVSGDCRWNADGDDCDYLQTYITYDPT
ncbi:MAG: dockerin type I domain-containing protein [Patescibacteria group bacterium]|jgi:hypothetical protein